MIKAVIFDMDGTLWDSSSEVSKCWEKVGKEFLGDSFSLNQNQVRNNMGKTMEDIFKEIMPLNTPKEIKEEFKKKLLEYELDYLNDNHPGKPYPNEEETFKELDRMGYQIYIVSNCQKGYIETYLKAYPNLARFIKGYLCWGDTGLPKRGTIRLLIEEKGISEAIYVGDTSFDEIETRGANIPFVFASYGFGTKIDPDEIIYSLDELPSKAKKLLC